MNTDNPLVLWILAAIAGLYVIVNAVDKLGGKVFETIRTWTDGKRRAARDTDDADIADLKRQLAHVSDQLSEVRAYQLRHDKVLVTHQAWDRQAIAASAGDLPAAPPLWPSSLVHRDQPPSA